MQHPLSPGASDSAVSIGLEPSDSDGVRWVVDQAQAELLLRYGVMVDSELSLSLHQFAPPLGAFVVARQPRSRHPIGGVGVRSVSAHIGEVKRLWVDDNERGKRVGLALMEAAQAAARDLG